MIYYNNDIDELKHIIGGEKYIVNEYISVYNPSVREVIYFGEDLYYGVLNFFIRKPYDIAVELYDAGRDYQTVTDFDLFYEVANRLPIELTCILFGKINFIDFVQAVNTENGLKCLINKYNPNFCIDEAIFKKIVSYLRYIHFISEKVEFDVGNSMAKEFLISRMRRKKKKQIRDYQLGKIKKKSELGNMIKFCVNNANFKYDYRSVMDLNLSLLYESYYYILYGDERDHVMSGIYHGTIDTKKMKDKSILNVIPDLHK